MGGGTDHCASAGEEPEHQAEDDADNQRGGERDVDALAIPLDHDIARQPPEPEFLAQHPYEADGDQYDPEQDEQLGHARALRV